MMRKNIKRLKFRLSCPALIDKLELLQIDVFKVAVICMLCVDSQVFCYNRLENKMLIRVRMFLVLYI